MMNMRATGKLTGALAAVLIACLSSSMCAPTAAAGFVRDEVRRQSYHHSPGEASDLPGEKNTVYGEGLSGCSSAAAGSPEDGTFEYIAAKAAKPQIKTGKDDPENAGFMVTAVVRLKGSWKPEGDGAPACGNMKASAGDRKPRTFEETEKPEDWKVRVNQTTCTVTVYHKGFPVRAFACSVGANGRTPDGTYSLMDKLRWWELMGPSWGQWCSHITGGILFHSIPYSGAGDKYSMSSHGYNMLGQAASHGCIRLAAMNAKYLYDNVPVGSEVEIFHGTADDDPLGKPMTPYVGCWDHSYDPTDPTI